MSAYRPVWAEIDLDAIRANVGAFASRVAPASVCAVVKADGYGHGAVEAGAAAIAGGADCLAVALVEEGVELRAAGLTAPILVLSEPVPEAAESVVAHGLTPVVYTTGGIDALAKAAASAGTTLPVHLKIDTGMHRVGAEPSRAIELARHVLEAEHLELGGVCTHFAVADEPGNDYTDVQRTQFEQVLAELRGAGIAAGTVHACNSAAALTAPDARYDMVRIGIGIYGVPPAPALASALEFRPAMALKARVSYVKQLPAGSRVSYGLRYELPEAARIATVPAGYADGVPRELSLHGGEVLIRGRRFPIVGTVTMDQFMVDAGDAVVEVGDDVVLLGTQGAETITAEEWAEHMSTIAYTIVCGVGPRVPRVYGGAGRTK
ncbi:MAG TPA: alanine racemase [Acidimicrobiia bacterium]|nr:alanine racemase [Acidimicrobiia bacterium]